MPIQFTCPHCGLRTNVSDEYAGQSGPCAGCGNTITVPLLPGPSPFGGAVPRRQRATPVVLILVIVLVFLFCSGILLAWFLPAGLLPAVQTAREAARRSQCSNNLRQIGLAMLNYHDVYGCYPPAYLAGENGRPAHSWRVLLLPFLEQQSLYDQYDFDEPWDSPKNSTLAPMMPQVYRCPSDTLSGLSETSYAMIVGPKTISNGASATKIQEITDGTSNTILVVEAAGGGINWLDPRDLEAERISYLVNDPVDGGILSEHADGANVLLCDGSTMFLRGAADPKDVRAMCSVSGGETVDRYALEFGTNADW